MVVSAPDIQGEGEGLYIESANENSVVAQFLCNCSRTESSAISAKKRSGQPGGFSLLDAITTFGLQDMGFPS